MSTSMLSLINICVCMAHMASHILLAMQKVQRLAVEERIPGEAEGEGDGMKVRHAPQGCVTSLSNMWHNLLSLLCDCRQGSTGQMLLKQARLHLYSNVT